jgi:peptide/nickel transport system substrate-binding protein
MSRTLLLFLLSFLIVGCGMQKQQPDTDFVFRYNESKGITTLDPAFARSLPLIWPTHQLFNGLVQLSDSLTIDPCIAHSWSKSDIGLVYSFYLR